MLQFQIQKSSAEFVRLSRLYGPFRGDELAPYPTLDALLEALGGSKGADTATRSRVVCAVLARHRAAPGPLGSAIVLHAFCGMLGRLSRKLVGVDRDDAEALVACSLIEALGRIRPARDPERIAMYVRQETRRVVFAALARDARARWYAQDDDDEGCFASSDDPWALDDDTEVAAATRRGRRVDLDSIADPASLEPIETRLDLQSPSADRVSDEDLLRAHAVRGGLRRLTRCLFEDASCREREHVYRRLLRRAQLLVVRRK
jgi:hypothetical protein